VQQIELLRLTIDVLKKLDIPYAIVGSFASSAWGEPRMTRDIDIVIQMTREHIEPFCSAFPDHDFYMSRRAVSEAVDRKFQFNLIHPASGNKVDFMVAGREGIPATQIARRRLIQFEPQTQAYIASPEDVILGKLVYYAEGGSEKHLRDIKGILKVVGQTLDTDYLITQAARLHVSEHWKAMTKESASDDPS
jgi:hypothetical protein